MSRGDSTRARILEHALAVASREGLEGLSIGTLARDVGMSKSGLFAHFGSKQELQLAVLDAAVESFVEHVVAPALTRPRGIPRIAALFDCWVEWEARKSLPGGCPFIAAAQEFDDQPGPVRDRLVAYQSDWIANLETAARIAVAEGHFRPDLDLPQFAYDFYSIILSYHHFGRLLREPRAEEHARRAFARLVAEAQTAEEIAS